MQPPPLPLIFRAYGTNTKPSTREERMSNLVIHWLEKQGYLLTNGPAEPNSRPVNTVYPLPTAIAEVRTRMQRHEPVYLWRYPLGLHIQLWTAGWDAYITPEILQPGGFHRRSQRLHTIHALQELLSYMHPLLMVGPTKQPPISISHALREYERWATLFIGADLLRKFDWEAALARRQAAVQRLNGGLWVKIPDTVGLGTAEVVT